MNKLSSCVSAFAIAWAISGLAATPAPELIATLPSSSSYPASDLHLGHAINSLGLVVPAAFFSVQAQNDSHVQVWVTDGTVEGTHPGATSPDFNADGGLFASASLGAFFASSTSATTYEIFKTNGPTSTTQPLSNNSFFVSRLVGLVDGQPVVVGPGPADMLSIWKIDPSSAAKALLGSFTLLGNPPEIALTDDTGLVISTLLTSQSDTYQVTSFKVDGSPAIVVPVPLPNIYWSYPHHAGTGSKLVCAEGFTNYPSLNPVQELYCSDGTSTGTHRPTPASELGNGVALQDFRTYYRLGDRLIFYATSLSPSFHFTPWVTDGTDAGTVALIDQSVGGWRICSDDRAGGVYFSGYAYPDSHTYLWYTDGTRAGTHHVADITSTPNSCALIGTAINHGGVAYLEIGTTLYRSDGTAAGTFPVAGSPSLTSYANSSIQGIIALGRWLIFYAPASATQQGLWRLDLDQIFNDKFGD